MRRIVKRALVIFVVAYVALAAALFWAMHQPLETFGRIMAHVPMPAMIILPFEPMWKIARGGRLQTGDAAPDFQLSTLDHQRSVQLSSFRGQRPVVLVFGSYT